MKGILLFFVSLHLQATELDLFLTKQGYHLTPAGTMIYEGYVTSKQREVFIRELKRHPEIRNIAEVGFNAGHTSEIFLEFVPESQVVSFDINLHAYTNVGVEFMKMKYKERFRFVEGDSRDTIVDYSMTHPDEKFDLIYIDGCHLFGVCLGDIFHFRSMAHQHSILWVDDSDYHEVQKAVEFASKLLVIEVLKEEFVQDEMGSRSWVEARYIFER